MPHRKLLFAPSAFYRALHPYFLVSKVFGFAPFSLQGPSGLWQIFCDTFLLLASLAAYTLTAYTSVNIHYTGDFYGSQIQFLCKMIFFLGKFAVTAVCMAINFLMKKNYQKLFHDIDAADEGLARQLHVQIGYEVQRKISIFYVAFSTIFLAACGILARLALYILTLPVPYILLQIYNTLSFAIFTGQFSLTVWLLQHRFRCLNAAFRYPPTEQQLPINLSFGIEHEEGRQVDLILYRCAIIYFQKTFSDQSITDGQSIEHRKTRREGANSGAEPN
jgi:hypothetical protein